MRSLNDKKDLGYAVPSWLMVRWHTRKGLRADKHFLEWLNTEDGKKAIFETDW